MQKTKSKFLTFFLILCLVSQVFLFWTPNIVYAGIFNNSENFVDNDSSDVDTHTDHGTSSNFTAQQDANVLYNDTLTEALTSGGSESWVTPTNYADPASGWNNEANGYDNNEATRADSNGIDKLSWSQYVYFNISSTTTSKIRYIVGRSSTYITTMMIGVFNGTWTDVFNDLPTYNAWENQTYTQIIDATAVRFRFYNARTTTSTYYSYVNETDVLSDGSALNYELDMEFQWTTIDYDEANEYICIRTGSTFNAENIIVKWRNGGTWTTLVTMTTVNTWYNTSLALTSDTLTLLFLGGTEISDAVQSTWQIECSLIHVWSVSGPSYDISTLRRSSEFAGYSYTFALNWSDSSGLGGFYLETNNTGPVQNETFTTFASLGAGNTWSNKTLTLNSTIDIVISYRFHANNTDNIWNSTGYFTFYTWKYPTPVSEKSFGSGFGNGRDMIYYNATAYGGKPAIYIAYLNTSSATWSFDVNCYDIQSSLWLNKYTLPAPYAQDTGATYTTSDLHWAPSITVLPNIGPYGGHLMYLYSYDSPLFYRLSTYNASTTTNLQQLINSWTIEYKDGWLGGLVPPYDFAYDTPFTWSDRLVMLGRTGEAFQGNITCIKYPANRIVNLWNDGNNTNSTTPWYFNGVAPYLDSNNASWIYCNSTAGATTPHFYFDNLTDILSENYTMTLSVFCQTTGGTDRAEVWINNGTSSYNLGNMGSSGWTNFTITSYINNFTKANNAYIYFRKLGDIYYDINISQACIVANYTGLGTDDTLVSFMSPPGNRQTAYHTSTKYGDNILVSFNKYWYNTVEASNNGTYFLYSDDKGDTWKSVNGTVLTTPVQGNTLLAYASPHFTRTCPALSQNNVPIILNQYCSVGWSELQLGWQTKIVSYSGTLGSAGTWSITNATDDSGNNIYGAPGYIYNCSTFYNRPTFWVSGSQNNNYITKYVMYPNDTTKFKAVWSDTDYQVDGSSQCIVQNVLQAYETVAGDRIFALGNVSADTYNQAASNSSIYGCKFTALRTGSISENFIYVNQSSLGVLWDAALYAENMTLLAQSANNTVFGAALISWVWHVTYPTPITVTSGTSYWICFRYGLSLGSVNNTLNYYYANDSYMVNQTFLANGYNDIIAGNYPTVIVPTAYFNRTIKIVATIVDAKMRGIGVDEYVMVFTNTGTNTTVKGATCLFYTYASDLSGLSYANFRSNNTGPWVNTTFIALSGTESWCNFSATLNNTLVIVAWEIRVNDTGNNWATTETQYITLTINLVVTLDGTIYLRTTILLTKLLYSPVTDVLTAHNSLAISKALSLNPSSIFNFPNIINSMKQVSSNFAETMKPNFDFNFLKALASPLGNTVIGSSFSESWKIVFFSASDTLKPYSSISTMLNLPSYFSVLISGLVPITDNVAMMKALANTFSETVKPNTNTMLLKALSTPLGSMFSSLGFEGYSKNLPIQASEIFKADVTSLLLKAFLSPLGNTVTVPAGIEATKNMVFNSSDFLKPFDSLTMTVGVAVAKIESFLGDLLNVQASLGATKNMAYLPADILKLSSGRFTPGLTVVEDLSEVWMVLGFLGFVFGICGFALAINKRRREE